MDEMMQKIPQSFIQEFPYGIPIEESLNRSMQYLSADIPNIKNWKDILFTPVEHYIHQQVFVFSEGKDMLIGFIVSQEATFLPDFISAIIQLFGGIYTIDNTTDLTFVQQFIYNSILFFIGLCSAKLAISIWLIINPYTMPWFVLLTATEWFMDSLAGIFPAFFGIEMSSSILLGLLASLAVYIKNLVLTMPYLPSEAIKESIGIHKVYTFGGIPILWKIFTVPDQVREEWYRSTPYLIENLMKYYGNEGVEFVPSRILKEFYNVNSNFGNTSYQNQIEIVDNMLDFVSNPNILENFNTHQFYNILNIL
jgi:hypothetical protein